MGVLAVAALGGCALTRAGQQREARQVETQLAASGFRKVTADTQEKTARLGGLPPYKLDRKPRNGKTYWYYADPACGCAYVGDDAAYSRFQRQVARDDRVANETPESMEATQDFFSPENPELYGAPENW